MFVSVYICIYEREKIGRYIYIIILTAGPLSPSITMPLPPLDLPPQEQQELGYMPHRDDFERVSADDRKRFYIISGYLDLVVVKEVTNFKHV